MRDSWCGDLGDAQVGGEVRVAGWVHRRRDHGGLIFIDLRDRSGLLQLVFHPETDPELFQLAERLRPEHVISASGGLVLRDPENVNPEMATGTVELAVSACDHVAVSQTPPFQIDEDGPVLPVETLPHAGRADRPNSLLQRARRLVSERHE